MHGSLCAFIITLSLFYTDSLSRQVFDNKSATEPTAPVRGSTLDALLAKRKAQKVAKKAATGTSRERQTASSPGPSRSNNEHDTRNTFSSPSNSKGKGHSKDLDDSETESDSETEPESE